VFLHCYDALATTSTSIHHLTLIGTVGIDPVIPRVLKRVNCCPHWKLMAMWWFVLMQLPGFDPHTHLRPPLANVPGGKPYVLRWILLYTSISLLPVHHMYCSVPPHNGTNCHLADLLSVQKQCTKFSVNFQNFLHYTLNLLRCFKIYNECDHNSDCAKYHHYVDTFKKFVDTAIPWTHFGKHVTFC